MNFRAENQIMQSTQYLNFRAKIMYCNKGNIWIFAPKIKINAFSGFSVMFFKIVYTVFVDKQELIRGSDKVDFILTKRRSVSRSRNAFSFFAAWENMHRTDLMIIITFQFFTTFKRFSNPTNNNSSFCKAKKKLCMVFENLRKSLIQYCERSKLRLHFECIKVHKYAKKMSRYFNLPSFDNLKLEVK